MTTSPTNNSNAPGGNPEASTPPTGDGFTLHSHRRRASGAGAAGLDRVAAIIRTACSFTCWTSLAIPTAARPGTGP